MNRMGDTEFWDDVADNLGEKKADVFAKIKEYISQFFNRVREIIGKASHTSEAAKIIDRVEADVQANLRRLYATVTVQDVQPLSYANRDNVVQKFTTQPATERMGEKYGGKETIRYSTRDYSDVSDLDLLLNAAEEISEGGGEEYWASLLENEPGLAGEAEEITRLGEQLKKTEAEQMTLDQLDGLLLLPIASIMHSAFCILHSDNWYIPWRTGVRRYRL